MKIPETLFERRKRQWYSFNCTWFIILVLVTIACCVGAVFGWIKYFSDDDFAPQFEALRAEDELLTSEINAERNARIAADMILMAEQAALDAAIQSEIATRTAEDQYLLDILNAEIAARVAAQAELNALLTAEIAARTAADDTFFAEMANLNERLANLTAYDVYALQLFMQIMTSLTVLDDRLAQETIDRINADNILAAQDAAQQAFIASFTIELANEIATRTAEDAAQLIAITPFLSGLFTVNGQQSLNHNMDIISGNAGFVIGSGGGNIITVDNNAIGLVDGGLPDPADNSIDVTAGFNIFITADPLLHTISVGAIAFAIPSNYASYSGFVSITSPNTVFAPGTWHFDASGTGFTPPATPQFITNFNTYNGLGWEVPIDGGTGLGYGIWVVRVVLVHTVRYEGTPFGVAFSVGSCVDTRANCIASPQLNDGQSSYVWLSAAGVIPSEFANWGFGFYDTRYEYTQIVDGRGVPPFTGPYPVWQLWLGKVGTLNHQYLISLTVTYDVTRVH